MKKIVKFGKRWEIIAVILLGLIPVLWFWGRGDVLINGVDTNFPLDPWVWFRRRFFTWSGVSNGGSDFSFGMAGMFFHLIQVVPFLIGFGLREVQIISAVFWFMLIVFGAFVFAKNVLTKNKALQLLFACLYALNPYMFNSWENIKVANLALVAGIPLLLLTIDRLGTKKIAYAQAALYLVLVGILVGGAGINPAYLTGLFAVVFIYCLGYVLADFGWRQMVWWTKVLLFGYVILIGVNLYWIIPTANYITGSVSLQNSIEAIGYTDWLSSLSENTSFLNVLRLQGAWDWYAQDAITKVPLYIPYAVNYFYRLPFLVYSFLLPALAMLAFVFRIEKRRHLYISFGTMMVVGLFLTAGAHPPTGGFFLWLSGNVPFFSLFRSPWYIFSPLIVVSVSALVVLLVEGLRRYWVFDETIKSYAVNIFAVILIVGNLLYSYPIIEGKIFRPESSGSFFVEFPEYIFDVARHLKGGDGRILGYPDDDLERFTWGYTGVDSILGLMTDRVVFFQSLNNVGVGVDGMVREAYGDIKKGRVSAAYAIWGKLGLEQILYKHDQVSLSPELPSAIVDLPSVVFGEWELIDLPISGSKVYFATSLYNRHGENAPILGVLGEDEVLVDSRDSMLEQIEYLGVSLGEVVMAETSETVDHAEAIYEFELPVAGRYAPVLDRYRLEDWGIDPNGPLELVLDEEQEIVWLPREVNDSYVYYHDQELASGEHKIVFGLESKNLIVDGDFETADRYVRDSHVGGEYLTVQEDGNRYLEIFNSGEKDVSASFLVSDFDPYSQYLVSVWRKKLYGNKAVIVMGQNNKDTLIKSQRQSLPNYPEWISYSERYFPVKTESEMRVSLVSPHTDDPLGTRVFFDDLEVRQVYVNDLFFVKKAEERLSKPEVKYREISPTKYEFEVSNVQGPHVIVISSNYSEDWKMKAGGLRSFHFKVNDFANAWYVDSAPDEYKMEIQYQPQRLFWMGSLISAGVIIVVAVLWVKKNL